MSLTFLDRAANAETVASVLQRDCVVAAKDLAAPELIEPVVAELRFQLDAEGLKSGSAFNGDLTHRYGGVTPLHVIGGGSTSDFTMSNQVLQWLPEWMGTLLHAPAFVEAGADPMAPRDIILQGGRKPAVFTALVNAGADLTRNTAPHRGGIHTERSHGRDTAGGARRSIRAGR